MALRSRVLSILAISIAEVRAVSFVVAGNKSAAKRSAVIFAIAVAAAVPFIAVAELIVTPIIEAAAPACITPTVLESFLVAFVVGAPLQVRGVASVRISISVALVRISATVPIGGRARLSGKEKTGHQYVRR